MENESNAIEIKDLSFKYKDQENEFALDNINLNIDRGQFVVIMGPSGAGKSTLANCLNGLVPHFKRGDFSGTVLVNNKNTVENKISTMAKGIGLVFQDFEAQLFSTNLELEIAFGPENFKFAREDIKDKIKNVLKTVKLEGLENRQPSTLSGGQKQRLAIGSVLSFEPDVICMDEPTTDLDPLGKLGIFNIAEELHEQSELTLIIIEHETEEALNGDRLLIMDEGKIICDGKPQDILKDVDFIGEIGIMPLQIPQYFSKISTLSKEKLPLDPEEGIQVFDNLDLKINEKKYQKILNKEKKRSEEYGEKIIEVKNLHHTYSDGTKALKGIDLDIRDGEFLAVLGHNGSGKTTFVKHLNALLEPTKGSVKVSGKETVKSSIYEIGKEIAYTFQNPDHQIFADTVYEEVAFSLKIRDIDEKEIDSRVKEALESVDMLGYEEEDPFSLTKGERQRIAVASILSARPRVIILDEPTTGLDYSEQKQMMDLIKKLNENGHTIIMITHTMWVVSEYAHRVAVINKGELSLYGNTRKVFKKEDQLMESYLKTPHIVSMSNKIGKIFLSVEEMISCTEGEI
jgi:energy-coupling factor transport system ATP-binding protein